MQLYTISKRAKPSSKFIAATLILLLNLMPAAPAFASYTPPTVTAPNVFANTSLPKVDSATGAFTLSVPLDIPPGRNGLQPDVTLDYNSQRTQDSIVGYGWQLSIPYIQRLNKTGSNNLYNTNPYFTSSIDGELATTSTSAGTYLARVDDGSFRQYSYATSTNTWTVYDKKGTRYLYGASDNSRQYDTTTGTSTNTYKWYLQEIRDTNNNYVKYVYAKDSNEVYPSQIVYTGNGSTDGPATISFATSTRPDIRESYAPDFLVTTNYRISEIDASFNGKLVRKYVLGYITGNNGFRSLLNSLQETGVDDNNNQLTLPPETFSYISTTTPFVKQNSVNGAAFIPADINGNGIPDINLATSYGSSITSCAGFDGGGISCNPGTASYPDYWAYQQNNGDGDFPYERGVRLLDINGSGKAAVIHNSNAPSNIATAMYLTSGNATWTATSTWQGTIPIFDYENYTTGLFGDVNGDGLPDYEFRIDGQNLPSQAYLGNGTAWDATTTVFSPAQSMPTNYPVPTNSQLVDVNGDGLADWVYSDNNNTYVLLNTGTGWESTPDPEWTIGTSTLYNAGSNTYYDRGIRFVDINGDGLPDMIHSYAPPTNYNYASAPWPDMSAFSQVFLNTGHGWATSTAYTLSSPIVAAQLTGGSWLGYMTHNEYTNFIGNGQMMQDVMSSVTYPKGGSTSVLYANSTQTGLNPNLPYELLVAASVINHDGRGSNEETDYSYAGGEQYLPSFVPDRKFAGFTSTTVTTVTGKTVTYYNQDDGVNTTLGKQSDGYAQINHPFRIDVMTPGGTLVRKTLNRWDTYPHGASTFVGLGDQLVQDYATDGTHQDTDTVYTYSAQNDDPLRTDVYGTSGGDIHSTVYSYATSTISNLSMPVEKKIYDTVPSTTGTTSVRVLVVAGGGHGGACGSIGASGGGGGGGGVQDVAKVVIGTGPVAVTVGNAGQNS